MEVTQDDVGLRVLEESDGLTARGRETDDDQALALEQRPNAELHDRVVLDREHTQDRAALALDLGPPKKGQRVGDVLRGLGFVGLIRGVVPGEANARRARGPRATDGLARGQGGSAAVGIILIGVDREDLAR
jgi:hypothetical protein